MSPSSYPAMDRLDDRPVTLFKELLARAVGILDVQPERWWTGQGIRRELGRLGLRACSCQEVADKQSEGVTCCRSPKGARSASSGGSQCPTT
jgi:hypothetical protein